MLADKLNLIRGRQESKKLLRLLGLQFLTSEPEMAIPLLTCFHASFFPFCPVKIRLRSGQNPSKSCVSEGTGRTLAGARRLKSIKSVRPQSRPTPRSRIVPTRYSKNGHSKRNGFKMDIFPVIPPGAKPIHAGKCFLGNSFFCANTCGACIRARANTGKHF